MFKPEALFLPESRRRIRQAAPIRLRRPEIFDTLDLEPRKFMMINLVWDDRLDQCSRVHSVLKEAFSIIPYMPVLCPVPAGMSLMFRHRISCPNLYCITSLDRCELNYLEYFSLAVIIAQPFMALEGPRVNLDAVTTNIPKGLRVRWLKERSRKVH